ncbi:glucose-1-phosphate thymidylyltransferase [Streptomyces huasconensis]|uniref:glucose-1-phosphate thymidylyltransferase n=1 Tax=Streptomyces huasconensis TaxID=1854574 RepID=UPI0036F8C36A
MKALVLAGGTGTRLRPLTHSSAKQLVPIANRPVLFHVLRDVADADIKEVGVVVGGTADEIRAAVADDDSVNLDITYIPQGEPLGLAHAVLTARDFLGDDDFVMYLGDNYLRGGITDLVADFRRARPAAQLLLAREDDPAGFGVAELDAAGRVRGLEEKPAAPKGDHVVVGVYVFTPAVHEAVRAIVPSWRGELEITHALQWLIDQGADVRSTTHAGYWKDTGNVADLLDANRVALESVEPLVAGDVDAATELVGRVRIATGAVVRGSRIVGPVAVGADTVITGCRVGPYTAIAERCHVQDSEIESSIVLPGSSITGVGRIEASLIGRHVEVTPAAPATHRLVLGDHCRVQLSP